MTNKKLYINIILLLSLSISQSIEQFNISFNKKSDIKINKNYYHHSGSNSQIINDSIIIDIFEYKFICSNKKFINVKINDQKWVSSNNDFLSTIPGNNIIISEPFFIRGTPIISIQLIPFKNDKKNSLQFLSSFNLDITIKNEPNLKQRNFIPNNIINHNFKIINSTSNLNTEYLILTPPDLIEAANELSSIHSLEVDEDERLLTEIVSTDSIENQYGAINAQNIRDYLLNYIEQDETFSLKYILLMGDENYIPPFYYNNSPTDDYYTSNSTINLNPQIPTGRIPVSNINDANNVIEQIRNYLITPNPGIWKSKVILLSDDQNHPNQEEFSHSINSNILYEIIKDDLNMINLYGTEYSPIPSNGWYSHPDFTFDIISNINSGASIINYIGHGNATSLAHENILVLDRDLNLIQADNQAIWIVGTCSFGYYDNNDCMAEKMLIKNNGSIAIITSTRSVYASTNIQYLTRVFNLITEFINNNIDSDLRLGDLFFLSKESTSDYLFQLFGDPALKINFPKKSNIINIDQSSPNFEIGQQNNISYNEIPSSNYSMIINGPEKYSDIGYSLPGDIIFQGDLNNNPVNFYLPLDITQCDTCKAKVTIFSESTINNSYTIDSNDSFSIINADLLEFNDNEGPKIYLSQNGYEIENHGLINYPFNVTILLSDQSGINLAGGLGHDLKYTINNYSYLANQVFNYFQEDSGYFTIDLNSFNDWPINLEIEAWDNLNNLSNKIFTLYSNDNPNFTIDKLYNFPNPFQIDTYFTFFPSEDSEITINIYTINGKLINKISSLVDASKLATIYWDGKDQYDREIPNGTYLYHIFAKSVSNQNFEQIQKLSKIK